MWQKWNIKAWDIGVLPASTWCSWNPAATLQGSSENTLVKRRWRHCLTVLDKLPVVCLHQHVSHANQDIPSWVPDFMESTLWTLFCHAWFFDCQKHEGCFQSLSFGIICHLGINDRTEELVYVSNVLWSVQWVWCLLCGAQWVWDPISRGSLIWRDIEEGLGERVGFPASGETFHFPVTDATVSPVPRVIQGAQFCALVLKPWPPQRCENIAPKLLHLCSPCILQCFPGGSVVKNPPANAGDLGLIPGLGRSPEEGNDNPL